MKQATPFDLNDSNTHPSCVQRTPSWGWSPYGSTQWRPHEPRKQCLKSAPKMDTQGILGVKGGDSSGCQVWPSLLTPDLNILNSLFRPLPSVIWGLYPLSILPPLFVDYTSDGHGSSWNLACQFSLSSCSFFFMEQIVLRPALWDNQESREGQGALGEY